VNYSTPSGKAARAIRSILADRRESVESLAEGTGIALSTLKRRLLLATPFTIDELGLIAQHFQVPITEVLVPLSDRPAALGATA
jgi:hypothetical protein